METDIPGFGYCARESFHRGVGCSCTGRHVKGLKTKEVGQSSNAMVIDNARSDCLAESKVDEHLAHHLVHVCDSFDRKLRKETKFR